MFMLLEVRIITGILEYPQWMKFRICNIYPATFCRMLHLCHTLHIDYLTECVQVLNENLLDLKNMMDGNSNNSQQNDKSRAEIIQKVLERLLDLKEDYCIIWKTSLLINRRFAWSQVFNIISNFIQLSCDLYWIVLCFFGIINCKVLLEIVLCLVLAPTVLSLMLTSANRCSTKSSKVGSLLHKIPIHGEWELYEVVDILSIQISQQPIRISAYTLMDFKYSLATKVR
ncbi:uncharacterized protein LOC129728550 [Wyeomyia smithii]|uniref:uncharacterized protein LOC129728550 n=1 Tax=Wyeomyia smithii TaxID=174621 RepID=UPI002467BB99|nr:uncharacterized protein LOC129728550 [Wyeomyia smithii]